jgi:putative ABC transport system substrate-binding protein
MAGGSMRRRDFITILGGASATLPFAAVAQQVGRTYHLGALMAHPRDVPVNVAFREEFRRYGFIDGQNLAVDWRVFGLDYGLIPQYAAELVGERVDVITTAGEEATRAAQQATKTIPIVAAVDDLLGSGFVQSLARPEGNITGINWLGVDLDGKRQDILIEAVPGLRRLAALADVNHAAAKLEALKEAARAHNVELSIYRIARGEEIAAAIDGAQASGATALNILSSVLFWGHRQLIRDRVAALRLPAIFPWPEEAEEGAFAAYGPRLGRLFAEVMPQQISKLFRGVKVADIPVEQPTTFELVINLKTAKAIGVTVLPALLLRADKLVLQPPWKVLSRTAGGGDLWHLGVSCE